MDADEVAIKVEHVNKTFKLPHEKAGSVKGLLTGLGRRQRGFEKQHVLKNVSFEIKKGEFFGIVGRNGSGKSTLLKLLAGIYTPDSGNIQINGKLTPFIELGVGFNPELTGRENVFLNGALLGFNRKEMSAMYGDIVAFAELKRFMDQKLKNYSSGMQVRLAFSIAIRAQNDILVLDEVLAVGDSAFQRKCLEYFRTLKKNKQTVVLVTHSMDTVEEYCDRAILINDGEVLSAGDARDIAAQYEQLNLASKSTEPNIINDGEGAKIKDVTINGVKNVVLKEHTPLRIEVAYQALKDVSVAASLSIIRSDGTFLANANTKKDPSIQTTKAREAKTLIFMLHTKQFLDGTYSIDTAIYDGDLYLDRRYNAAQFTITTEKNINKLGLFNLDGSWSTDDA